ncbi:MAG TPA: hypothetical protein VLK25_08895 [Allosphingosinicella sp.]|nr:hypothetical protein [Allosphingosinicella sp.]
MIVLVAAMGVGTKRYTDGRYQASQDALESENAYCRALRDAGRPMTDSDREICENIYNRDGDRNDQDEMVAMMLYGATGLVALIGIVLILRRRRPAVAGPEGGPGPS